MALRKSAIALAACVLASFLASPLDPARAGGASPTADDIRQDREKTAFETAKELGSADAWNAFLSAYPSGFYADMARAYLKKVGQVDEPTLVPSSARAGERSCRDRNRLRSEKSDAPTKITFVNRSGMYRAVMWIDFGGGLKDYGGLNDGEEKVIDTFLTHPWMIATGPGDCLQIFMPAAEPATVELVRLDADDPKPECKPVEKRTEPKKEPKKTPLVCASNYKLQNGRCVLVQNCGKNAYRSAEGDCHCNKGYRMQNGKCVWPQDKQGFEVAPWKKSGCKTWQRQCSQGNAKACGQYEASCQVN